MRPSTDLLLTTRHHTRGGGGYRNIGHKALRARALADIADCLGWDNAHEIIYTVVPDLGCSPRLYGLWTEIGNTVKIELAGLGKPVALHQADDGPRGGRHVRAALHEDVKVSDDMAEHTNGTANANGAATLTHTRSGDKTATGTAPCNLKDAWAMRNATAQAMLLAEAHLQAEVAAIVEELVALVETFSPERGAQLRERVRPTAWGRFPRFTAA